MFLKTLAIYLLLLFSVTIINANDDLNIEEDFLQSLEEVSEIATKTKLNVDDSTSFVSVLRSDKLINLGVRNVFEALQYVPGIELSQEASGVKTVIFRASLTKGEVKFMVDGVEINNAYRASYYYYLDFPIELVSRIEVLRGAGSVLYGSGAISGVINIITKASQSTSKNSQVFVSGGTYSYAKGGTLLSVNEELYKLSVDAYYQKDDKEINSMDKRTKDYSMGLNFQSYDFTLNARIKNSIQGNDNGVLGIPDLSKDKYDNQNKAIYTNLKYDKKVSKNNRFNFSINYNEYAQIVETRYSGGDISSDYKEKSYYAKAELQNSSVQNNNLLLGIKFKHANALNTDLQGFSGKTDIVSPDSSRDTSSIYVNDNYLLTQNINISLGLRYDDYSDFGDYFSPNIGLVYRATQKLNFKIKHAHSLRAPSWTELSGLSGNTDLKAETSKNTEIGLIYKPRANNRITLNAYTSTIENYIYKHTTQYQQHGSISVLGSELEYSYLPNNNIEFDFLASYIDAKDADDETINTIANFLSTSSFIYSTNNGFIFGSTLRYKDLKGINNDIIYDQAFSYLYKTLRVNLVAKNIFDSIQESNDGRVLRINASLEF